MSSEPFHVSADGADVLRTSKDRLVEIVTEFARRFGFPDKPSRFTGVFAFATLEAAGAFRKVHAEESDPIWRVETDGSVHEGDSRFVGLGSTPVRVMDNALLYWSGVEMPKASWSREVLLEAPVRVVGPA
jgi:hypothetical protein